MMVPLSDAERITLRRIQRAIPALTAWHAIHNATQEDVAHSLSDARQVYASGSSNAYYSRVAVRVLFSFCEGHVYGLKRIAFAAASTEDEVFNPAELLALSDQAYSLGKKGEVDVRDSFPAFLPSVRLAHRMVERAFGVPCVPDYDGDGWRKLTEGHKVRNRLTHPKRPEDLDVTPPDFQHIVEGMLWFLDSHEQWFLALVKHRAQLKARVRDTSDDVGGAL